MSEDALHDLAEGLGRAIEAAIKALIALLLVLATLLVRAMQAVFILARPAALAGTVVAAGYGSATLFMTVLQRYGGDLPAALLALSAVVITPATLLVLKADSGTWAVMLATAVIDFLVHLGIERAPPVVIAALPAIGLAAVTLYHLRATQDPPTGQQEQGENDVSTHLDHDNRASDLQRDVQL